MTRCPILNDSKLEKSCQPFKVPQQIFNSDFMFIGGHCLYASFLSELRAGDFSNFIILSVFTCWDFSKRKTFFY